MLTSLQSMRNPQLGVPPPRGMTTPSRVRSFSQVDTHCAQSPSFERSTPVHEAYKHEVGGIVVGYTGHIKRGHEHVGSSVAGGVRDHPAECSPLPYYAPGPPRSPEQKRLSAFARAERVAQNDATVRQYASCSGTNRFAPFGVDPDDPKQHADLQPSAQGRMTDRSDVSEAATDVYLAKPEEATQLWHFASRHGSWGGYLNMSERHGCRERRASAPKPGGVGGDGGAIRGAVWTVREEPRWALTSYAIEDGGSSSSRGRASSGAPPRTPPSNRRDGQSIGQQSDVRGSRPYSAYSERRRAVSAGWSVRSPSSPAWPTSTAAASSRVALKRDQRLRTALVPRDGHASRRDAHLLSA
jgi:hypothetical protein